MRVLLHQLAVLEGAGLALVGVAYEILGFRRLLGDEAPLHAGREARPAAAAQPRGLHHLDALVGRPLTKDCRGGLVAAALPVDLERGEPRRLDVLEEERPARGAHRSVSSRASTFASSRFSW